MLGYEIDSRRLIEGAYCLHSKRIREQGGWGLCGRGKGGGEETRMGEGGEDVERERGGERSHVLPEHCCIDADACFWRQLLEPLRTQRA